MQIEPKDATVKHITDFVDKCISDEHEEFLPSTFHDPYIHIRTLPDISSRRFKKYMYSFPEHDIVIFYYSPSCPHCKNYFPKY
jgi:hypothetical protein